MAVKVLTTARTAIEATAGSSMGTATRLLYFAEGTHEQVVATIAPTELRNSYFRQFRAYPGIETNDFAFSGDATYDDLGFWLNLVMQGGGTATGATADKTWTFLANPNAAGTDVKSLTVEFGYGDLISTVGWKVPGVYVDEFSLKFAKDAAVTYDAKCLATGAATQIQAFTGTLSDRTNITITGPTMKAYVDSTTLGSTLDPNVMAAEFSIKQGWTRQYGMDGTAVARGMLHGDTREVALTLTRYFANKTELDTYLLKTPRKVRLSTVGPTLAATTYSLVLDFVGIPDTHKVAEADGLIVAEIGLTGYYDSGIAGDHKAVLVNATVGPYT
jgi:hypothetical protein